MSKATIVCMALSLFACASGGQPDNEGVQDAALGGPHDASNVTTPDAPKVRMDGGVTTQPQDAQVSQVPQDAPAQSGPFCTANSQCTNAGECCVTLGGPQGFCGPGTVVLGECFPQ